MMRLLFIACVCTLASTAAWAAKPMSLAELKRHEAAVQKQEDERRQKKQEKAERRKTKLQRDLETYGSYKATISKWFEATAEARQENIPWEQRLVDFSTLMHASSSPWFSAQLMLGALAVNLANAYQGKPAEGVGEVVAQNYREQPKASFVALRALTEDTMVLVALAINRERRSQKETRRLMQAFATKFTEHAQMVLPELEGELAQLTANQEQIGSILDDDRRKKDDARAVEHRATILATTPQQITDLLKAASESRQKQPDPVLRVASLTEDLPGNIEEFEAQIWLSELAIRAQTTFDRQQAEDLFLLANAIALKTDFHGREVLRRTRIKTIVAQSLAVPLFAFAAVLIQQTTNSPSLVGVLGAASISSLMAAALNSFALKHQAIETPIEPFSKSAVERANQKQAEKMMAYFFAALGFERGEIALHGFESAAFCDKLLAVKNKIRVDNKPEQEPLEEEFEPESENKKRNYL